MAITVKGLDHVVLRVADLERAIAFYGGVLGCREERRVESIKLVQLRAGSTLIDLIQADGPVAANSGNMDHFCLRIDPFEEAQIRAHLESRGVSAGPTEQRYGAEGEGPSIYIADSDGNTVELKGPPNAA